MGKEVYEGMLIKSMGYPGFVNAVDTGISKKRIHDFFQDKIPEDFKGKKVRYTETLERSDESFEQAFKIELI